MRSLLLIMLILLSFGSLEAKKTKPHIVLILADDLGWNDIGFQGNSGMPTPILNDLAANGVILEDQYVTPWCTPTRAAIMTGRYPMRYGLQHIVAMPQRAMGLSLDEKILPQFLKERGYATHLMGKWHLGMYDPAFLPTSRGFDTFYGTYHNVHHITHLKTVSNANINCPAGGARDVENDSTNIRLCSELYSELSQCQTLNSTKRCQIVANAFSASGCFDKFIDLETEDSIPIGGRVGRSLPPTFTGKSWQRDTPTSKSRSTDREGMFSSQDIAEEAKDILDAHGEKDPLFMVLAFQAVHSPIVFDAENADPACFDGRFPLPARSQLCTMVKGMDNAVGQVVDKLKEKNMYDNTVIIFLSDNGGQNFQSSNAPFKGSKSTLLQGGVRVPAFVHAPGRLNEVGISKGGYIHAVDWFQTILKLSKGTKSKRFEGKEDVDRFERGEGEGEGEGKGEGEGESESEDGGEDGDVIIDGKDMWKFISEKKKSPRKELLLNIDPLCIIQAVQPQIFTVGPHAALISGDWKYYEGDPGSLFYGNCFLGDGKTIPGGTLEYLCTFPLNSDGVALVNLKDDPYEEVNVADDYPHVVAKMREKMEEYREGLVEPQWPDPDPLSDPSLYDGCWTPWENNS